MFLVLETVKVTVEVSELVREDIAVWYDVKLVLAPLLLHLDHVGNQSILPRQLIRVGKVVDLLVLLQLLVDVSVHASR